MDRLIILAGVETQRRGRTTQLSTARQSRPRYGYGQSAKISEEDNDGEGRRTTMAHSWNQTFSGLT